MLDLFADLRYLGIFLGLVLTGMGLPVPEELLVIVAGVMSYHETMDWRLALPVCLLGALLGDCAMYGIGYHFGRRLVQNHGWFSRLLHAEHEKKFEGMINRHGLKVLMLARFLAGFRAPIYIASGIMRVPFRTFVFIDSLCALLVIPLFFGLGYVFGDRMKIWWEHIQRAERAAVVIILISAAIGGVTWYCLHRRKVKRRAIEELARATAAPSESASPIEAARPVG